MSASAQAAAMLRELMGTDDTAAEELEYVFRTVLPQQPKTGSSVTLCSLLSLLPLFFVHRYTDPKVCKSFLCGCCPNAMVENTVSATRSTLLPHQSRCFCSLLGGFHAAFD